MTDPPPTEVEITLAIEKVDDQDAWRRAAARKLKMPPVRIASLELLKKSIDARRAPVRFRLRLAVGIDALQAPREPGKREFAAISGQAKRVIIVGCGQAGMFAALRFLQLGYQPVILERGNDVSACRWPPFCGRER